MSIEQLTKEIAKFASDRDWEQFHTPKNLIMALAGEVGELSEIFQWLTEEQSKQLSQKQLDLASEEIADIFIYLLRLSDTLKINVIEASRKKILLNSEKYPIALAKGNAEKYNRREN